MGEHFVQISRLLASNKGLTERLKRLESGPAQSFLTKHQDPDFSSLSTLQRCPSNPTTRSTKIRLAFEHLLQVSGVYRRALLRYPSHSMESLTSLAVSRNMGLSFLSGLALTDISHISVLSLPIYSFEISNSDCYSFEVATDQDNEIIFESDFNQLISNIHKFVPLVPHGSNIDVYLVTHVVTWGRGNLWKSRQPEELCRFESNLDQLAPGILNNPSLREFSSTLSSRWGKKPPSPHSRRILKASIPSPSTSIPPYIPATQSPHI